MYWRPVAGAALPPDVVGRVAGALVLGGAAAGEGEGGRDDGAEGDAVESHR